MAWRRMLGGIAGLILLPGTTLAADRAPLDFPVWTVGPFILLLVLIAFLPIVAAQFWHSNFKKLLVVAVVAGPLALYLAFFELQPQGREGLYALTHGLAEYLDFILLLIALFTVAGGIVVHGSFAPRPVVNTA